jgi:DNA primase
MTGIMELLEADGIHPKKVSTSEYHSPCPICGGKDRFVTWPNKGDTGRAWCRQCNFAVDGIGYLMQIHSMTFPEAAEQIGKNISPTARKGNRGIAPRQAEHNKYSEPVQKAAEPEETIEPSAQWREAAGLFTTWAADNLRKNPERLEWLRRERGISSETAKQWRLGWNPAPLKRPGTKWDITDVELSLPAGLVIPNIRNGLPISVKIRRESGDPKYHLVRGSKVFPYLLPGYVNGTIALVESELDALLIWETARHILTPIAGGGCSNKPDIETMELIARAEILLDCMDNDEAGEKAGAWWNDWFPNCLRWKPTHKDPCEMFQAGKSVREWLLKGRRAALRERGEESNKLDFFDAVDLLAIPFSESMLQKLSEEEIERLAIMKENERD